MNIPTTRIAFSMLVLALCARAGFAAQPPAVPPVKADNIEAALVPDNATVMQGEPLFATLVLKNNSGRALNLSIGSETGMVEFASAGGREEMRISAVDKAGRKAPLFRWDCGIVGWEIHNPSGRRLALPASGKASLRVCVTVWVVFDQPGTYTVTAAPAGLLSVRLKRKGDDGGAFYALEKLNITASGTVEVVPADGAKLGALIDGLVKKASSGRDDAGTREAVQMLETTTDPRVAPWLRDKAEKGGPKNRVDDKAGAIRALSRIDDDSAVKALEELLEAAKTDDLRTAACIALLHSPDLRATAWLQTQGGNANDLVATYAKTAKGISAVLAPEKPAILPGEPIYATLTVTNKTDFGVMMMARSDGPSMEGGMEPGIKLVAIGKDGTPAPAAPYTKEAQPPIAEQKSYPRSMDIPASGSAQVRLFLPWRVVLERPGSYTLAVTSDIAFYKIDMAHQEAAQRVNHPVVIPVNAAAPLVVQPEDKAKMGALIDALEKKASFAVAAANTRQPVETREQQLADAMDAADALHKLEWINDGRVIPFLRNVKSDYMMEMDALSKFNNDGVLEFLEAALTAEPANSASHKTDAGAFTPMHMAACDALMRSPHPGAIPFLLTQRKSPDLQVRIKVVEAVAMRLPPNEAIPILEQMQDDSQPWVGRFARTYLAEIKAGLKVITEYNEYSDDGK